MLTMHDELPRATKKPPRHPQDTSKRAPRGPKGRLRWPKRRPSPPVNAPKSTPGRPKTPQDVLRCPQEPLKSSKMFLGASRSPRFPQDAPKRIIFIVLLLFYTFGGNSVFKAPKSPLRYPQGTPRRPQDAPTSVNEGPRCAQVRP
jgi:hypothetical protein